MSNEPAYSEWTINPGETLFSSIGSDGETYQATMEDLTGGKYRLAGQGILNTETGRFAGSINRSGTSSLIVRNDGSFLLVNSTDISGITTYGKQSLVNAASIESEFTTPDGITNEINVPYANINRIGKQLLVNDTIPENIQYRWVDINQEVLPPDYRTATNTEAIEYGLTSALLRQYRNVVQTLADSGIEDENGNPISTITDAAAFMARNLMSSGQYAHIFELS